MTKITEITVKEYIELIKTEPNDQLLDVRTLDEFKHVNVGGTHIPLQELEDRHTELSKDTSFTVMCHHGRRSAQACHFLQDLGYKVRNLEGGIDAWSLDIDNDIVRY